MDKTDVLTADSPPTGVPSQNQRQPSEWQAEFSGNAIIEYRCGNCHKNIYYSCWRATYCPHCGAPIFKFPRQKMDAPQHRGWGYADQERLKYAGPGRGKPGAKTKHKNLDGNRPGQAAGNKRHKRRTVP